MGRDVKLEFEAKQNFSEHNRILRDLREAREAKNAATVISDGLWRILNGTTSEDRAEVFDRFGIRATSQAIPRRIKVHAVDNWMQIAAEFHSFYKTKSLKCDEAIQDKEVAYNDNVLKAAGHYVLNKEAYVDMALEDARRANQQGANYEIRIGGEVVAHHGAAEEDLSLAKTFAGHRPTHPDESQ